MTATLLTAAYWRKKEWSMGNGQCPKCLGVHEGWLGHPLHFNAASIGHKKDCLLAEALEELGETPVMVGEFKSDKKFEHFITEQGIFGVRGKTKDGCPRYKEFAKQVGADKLAAAAYEEAFGFGKQMDVEGSDVRND